MTQRIYDVAVIGGGPAGCMAAIRAAGLGKAVVLIERNDSIGKKILITGKGRCNLTNSSPIDTFIKKFNPGGEFLRTAFFAFSNEDLMDFFRSNGLELKCERQGRVFPADDKASSVVSILENVLKQSGVDTAYNTRITGITHKKDQFIIELEAGDKIKAKKVVLATGGVSYKATGSAGDGFVIAEQLKHELTPFLPALVPLKTKENWIKSLQGLALEHIKITFCLGKKKIISDVGELMFTHFGVSGPLVLDLSGDVMAELEKHKEIKMEIDLKPGLRIEQLESKFVHKFAVKGNIQMKNLMQDVLPKRMIPVFLSLAGIDEDKRTNQVTKTDRKKMIDMLKRFPLTIVGSLPVEEAMVTAGGVSKDDINPRTMESRKVPGLYFAGEIIEGAASSGGYNLQQAFSTGYLAGTCAAG